MCLMLASMPASAQQSPGEIYSEARKAEKKGEMALAYALYSQAAALEPKNRTYWLRSQSVKRRAAMQARPLPTTLPDPAADSPDPSPYRTQLSSLDARRRLSTTSTSASSTNRCSLSP